MRPRISAGTGLVRLQADRPVDGLAVKGLGAAVVAAAGFLRSELTFDRHLEAALDVAVDRLEVVAHRRALVEDDVDRAVDRFDPRLAERTGEGEPHGAVDRVRARGSGDS